MARSATTGTVDGSMIRTLRQRRGWSLETLGARVGITRKGMSRIELRGSTTIPRAVAIAHALGVGLGALLPVRRSGRRSPQNLPPDPE